MSELSQNSHTDQTGLGTLVNPPSPCDRPRHTDDKLNSRVADLPEKCRAAYERICAVKRDAASELRINQRANFDRMVQEKSASERLRLSLSKQTKQPAKEIERQADTAARHWACGVIDGQRAALEDYFLSMKQRFVDQSENEHNRLRDRLNRARIGRRGKSRSTSC